MKEYFIEFKIGTSINLNNNYTEDELFEAVENATSELRLGSYDDYVLFDENGERLDK